MRRFTKYYYGDQIEEDDRGRACSMNGRNKYKILVGKSEWKRPLEDLGVYDMV
jgi:hypothetical protein